MNDNHIHRGVKCIYRDENETLEDKKITAKIDVRHFFLQRLAIYRHIKSQYTGLCYYHTCTWTELYGQ